MPKRTTWLRPFLGGAGALALVALPFAFQPVAGASAPVAQGIAQSVVQQATAFGSTPSSTPVEVSIVLNARNQAQLSQFVSDAARSHRFQSVQQFAQQYGQSPLVIAAIQAYLSQFGIQSQTMSDNLDIQAEGTAGQFDQAFSVQLLDMSYRGQHFHGTRQNPEVPGNLASPILAVLGLTNYQGMFVSHAVKALGHPSPASQSSTETPAGLSATFVAQHYDATPLYAQGDLGQGRTIGIVTLASLNPSDAFTYWQDIGVSVNPDRLQLVNVDGGAGAPSLDLGSDETSLDVEQSGALAPMANIDVYQAPNTDYGYADAFYQAISQNQVDSLSTSWGESEDAINYYISQGQEAPAYAQVFNQAFMEAAAQGISVFAASGDAGAYDASRDLGTTDLSIDNPADSPYITAAGGSTLAGTQNYGPGAVVTVPQERTWGWDYLWPLWQAFGFPSEQQFALAAIGGSGGGYSSIFPTPDYQLGIPGYRTFSAVPYLTPIDQNTSWSFNAMPSVVQGVGQGRATPDLALNADPQTGYGVYTTLFAPAYGTDWVQYGGTSFVAPQLAGLTALIDDSAGTRVGLWNPQIYGFAQGPHSPFTPLDAQGTSNDNLYYTGAPGAVYNPGSGLGLPDIAALAQDFAQPTGAGGGPAPGGPGGFGDGH